MQLSNYWAKTTPFQSVTTHGLISGHVAKVLAEKYLSAGTRSLLQTALQMEEQEMYSYLGYMASLHDIGKIEYSFQAKNPEMKTKLDKLPENINKLFDPKVRHEKTGLFCLKEIWKQSGENRRMADLLSKVIGAHHPGRVGHGGFDQVSAWQEMRKEYELLMRSTFRGFKGLSDIEKDKVGTVGAILLAILILSDWIASGNQFSDAESWIGEPKAEGRIDNAILDFLYRSELMPMHIEWPERFSEVWPFITTEARRPLQIDTEALFESVSNPIRMLLIEAPMGEGKTEAGVFAALQMAKQWGKDGIYFALPTAATANQMVGRIRDLLTMHHLEGKVRLLHSMAWMDSMGDYEKNREEESDEIASWLAPVRRGLLGQFAVGTVDQAMLAATTVKYGALRLLGLSNKVIVIDEIHSYDAYMSEIIKRLLEWCRALEIPVVMLSATLPAEKKQELFSPYTDNVLSKAYPLITAIHMNGSITERVVGETTHKMIAKVKTIACLNSVDQIAAEAVGLVEDGGCICVLMNTVKEAQTVYSAIRKRYDGDMMLFHGQFTVQRRSEIERDCISRYGKDKSNRPHRSILVATQVVEQSLDVDFDAMITAVAPIDLLLQRLGRVQRHEKTERPPRFQKADFRILIPGEGQDFGMSTFIYPETLLKSSVRILKNVNEIHIPEDIASMVQDGYSPENIAPEDLQQWMENRIKEQVEAGASQQYLINPPGKQYNALIEDSIFNDDANHLMVATRLGEPTVRLALLEQNQYDIVSSCLTEIDGSIYAEIWSKAAAEQVMMQSVSVSLSRFNRELRGISYVNGGKLLRGTRIIKVENGIYRLENGKMLCDDKDLGLLIKGGEE